MNKKLDLTLGGIWIADERCINFEVLIDSDY